MTLSRETASTIVKVENKKKDVSFAIQESYSRLLKLAEAGKRENYEVYIQKEIDTLQEQLKTLAETNQRLLDERYGKLSAAEVN